MTTLKGLAIVALLFGGSSLALAQTAPTTGGSPPANVTTGPTGAPAYTSGQTAPSAHAATQHKKTHMSAKSGHHKKMYMSAKGIHHKPLKTGQPQPKQPK